MGQIMNESLTDTVSTHLRTYLPIDSDDVCLKRRPSGFCLTVTLDVKCSCLTPRTTPQRTTTFSFTGQTRSDDPRVLH